MDITYVYLDARYTTTYMVKSPLSKINLKRTWSSGFFRDHPKFLFGHVLLVEIDTETIISFRLAPPKVQNNSIAYISLNSKHFLVLAYFQI